MVGNKLAQQPQLEFNRLTQADIAMVSGVRTAYLIALSLISQGILLFGQGDAPSEETRVLGLDRTGHVTADDILHPYLPAVQRSLGMSQWMEEMLFNISHETNELVPWLAIGYETNDDFTEYAISSRDGVN